MPKGKGKYKEKIPLIFFSCEEVVTLLQGVQTKKIKITKNSSSSKARKIPRATKTTKTKVRNLVILLKILIVTMKMKWYILLLKMN